MKRNWKRAVTALVLAGAMLITAAAADPLKKLTLTDVETGKWYADAVCYAVAHEWMDIAEQQDEDTALFAPLNRAPRQQVADAIYRFANTLDSRLVKSLSSKNADKAPDFDAVAPSCQDAIRFCYGAGILTGDAQHNLHPADAITREEFAAVLQRFVTLYGEKGYMTDIAATDVLSPDQFTDDAEIAGWARSGIAFCKANGIMNGNANGSFNPKGSITRAELAQVLYNFVPAEMQ